MTPLPFAPWHRLVICSHLILLCGGLLLAYWWSCPPPGPFSSMCDCLCAVLSLLSFLVFGRFLGSSLAVAPLCRFLLLWFCLLVCGFLPFGLGVPSLVLRCVLVCCFCCVVGCLPSPAGCCLPPPFGCSLAAFWPSYCAGPLLWVFGCFLRRPGCLALLLGVWWCFVSSLHLVSWQQGLWPCVGFCYPLHHDACVVVVLCAPAQGYSS